MTDGEAPRKKGGRPRVYPGTEKRPTLTFRVRDRMHEQLSKAAEEGGRSLSEEIERRLDQSFTFAEIIKTSAEEAAKTTLRERFGSREIFEAAELYGQILTGLVNRLQRQAGPDRDWYDPLDPARDYLKTELLARINDMVEVFFLDLALKNLEGSERYEAGAMARERTIPREIAGAHLSLDWRKHDLRHKLLPHIMDKQGESGTDDVEGLQKGTD